MFKSNAPIPFFALLLSAVALAAASFTQSAAIAQGDPMTSAAQATPAPSDISPELAIHSGSCADFLPTATFDVGSMIEVPVQDVFEGTAAETALSTDYDEYFEDGIYDDADEGYLYDDLDDDDTSEIGVDVNADGVLDEDEVIGEDLDDDLALNESEVTVTTVITIPDFQTVWKVDVGDAGFDGEELIREGPYVMVVHASASNYDEILACGPILDIVEEEQVVVPLRQYQDSGYFGVGLVQVNTGEVAAYLYVGVSALGDQGISTAGAPDTAALGPDGVLNADDEGYLADDLDGDGLDEIGIDENGDGVLDDAEVFGEDADDDGDLDDDEFLDLFD